MKDENVIATEEDIRIGATDRGARVVEHPCTKTTWCTLALDHAGGCDEKPRYPIAPSNIGPRRKP